MRPGSATLLPVSTASTGLPCLPVGARVHHGRSDTEVSMWPLPYAYHIQCMTILGVPGWAPAEDTQRPTLVVTRVIKCGLQELQGRAIHSCTRGFSPGSLHVCAGWCSTCNGTSRRKGQIGIITSSHCALP